MIQKQTKHENFDIFYIIICQLGWRLSLFLIVIGIFLFPNIILAREITSENIIVLTNEKRNDFGLNSLTANQLLSQAAYNKGAEIIEHQAAILLDRRHFIPSQKEAASIILNSQINFNNCKIVSY